MDANLSNNLILVVEDSPLTQVLARKLIEPLGLKVEVVDNGEAAIEAAMRTDFALILMDIGLKGLSGMDATKAIRQNELGKERHVPIVAVTSFCLPEHYEQCLAAGMDDYLTKPFTAQQFEEIIEKWLPKQSLKSGS